MKRLCVELVQVIEVISAIASSEDVDLIVVSISRVHVAGTRRLSCVSEVDPAHLNQVQDVHIIGGKGALTKPTTYYEEPASDQSCSVAVPFWRGDAS